MGERWDRLRSAVHHAAGRVRERAENGAVTTTLGKLRHAAGQIAARRAPVPLSAIRRVIMAVPDVAAASVSIVPREVGHALGVDIELASGRSIRAEIAPAGSHFAPRGAKELSFVVVPETAAAEPAIRELCGALAALIARTLWSASLPPASSAHESGLVDREGTTLRIDLRTIPSVRTAMARGPAVATLLDVMTPESMEMSPEGLMIRIGLPQLTP